MVSLSIKTELRHLAHWLSVEQGIEAEASRVEEGGGRFRWVLTWRDGPADLPRLGDMAAEIGLDARRFSVARVITGQALAVTAARIAVRGNCRSTRTRLGWLRPSRPRPAAPTTLADQPAARRNRWPRGCPGSRTTTPTRAATALGHLATGGVPGSRPDLDPAAPAVDRSSRLGRPRAGQDRGPHKGGPSPGQAARIRALTAPASAGNPLMANARLRAASPAPGNVGRAWRGQ